MFCSKIKRYFQFLVSFTLVVCILSSHIVYAENDVTDDTNTKSSVTSTQEVVGLYDSENVGADESTLNREILYAKASGAKVVINATEYGVIANDDVDDTEAFNKVLEQIKESQGRQIEVVLPGGTLDFEKNTSATIDSFIRFEDVENLSIIGDNTTFLFHGIQKGIVFDACKNIFITGINIDWKRAPFSIGEIVYSDGQSFIVKVDDDYPIDANTSIKAFIEYDSETKSPCIGGNDIYGDVTGVSQIFGQYLRVTFGTKYQKTPDDAHVVLRHEIYGYDGFTLEQCSNITFEGVNIYTAPGMGIMGYSSENLYFNRFNVMLKPETDRLMSVTADAMHLQDCTGEVKVTNSIFENCGDDAFNAHGAYLNIMENIDDYTVYAENPRGYNFMPEEGDILEISASNTLIPVLSAKVVSVEQRENSNGFIIKLDGQIPQEEGTVYVIANATRTPNIEYRNNLVRNKRCRGILIQTRNAVVENNTFSNLGNGGVLITTDVAEWYESIGSHNVAVRNNKFVGNNWANVKTEADISIVSYTEDGSVAPAGVFKDILIENNYIRDTGNAGIFVNSTENVEIIHNLISRTGLMYSSELYNCGIGLTCVEQAKIEYNEIHSNDLENFQSVKLWKEFNHENSSVSNNCQKKVARTYFDGEKGLTTSGIYSFENVVFSTNEQYYRDSKVVSPISEGSASIVLTIDASNVVETASVISYSSKETVDNRYYVSTDAENWTQIGTENIVSTDVDQKSDGKLNMYDGNFTRIDRVYNIPNDSKYIKVEMVISEDSQFGLDYIDIYNDTHNYDEFSGDQMINHAHKRCADCGQVCYCGDANSDGIVDVVDLVRTKKYLSNKKVSICEDAMDRDSDGSIISDDLDWVRSLLVDSRNYTTLEKYFNDFDANNRLVVDIDNVPDSEIVTNGSTIDNNSLILNTSGEFKGMFLKGIPLDCRGTYRVYFNYKVIERADLFYFKFVSDTGYAIDTSFGDASVSLNEVKTFDKIFQLNGTGEMVMQIFPGSTVGNSSLVVDDILIERLDATFPVFAEKSITETTPIVEDFAKGLYHGSITPSQQETGEFYINHNSENLELRMPDPYSGVKFDKGITYIAGEKYTVAFDYEIKDNPNDSAFYVQIGGVDYKEVKGITTGSAGKVLTTLTAGSANGNPEVLQIFGNQSDLKMTIDNLVIEKFSLPEDLLEEDFDSTSVYSWESNNAGVLNLTSDKEKIPTNGKNNALSIECSNVYDGLIMTPLYEKLEISKTYNVAFSIKGISVPDGAGIYVQSGTEFVLIPITKNMDETVHARLTAQTDNVQLFSSVEGLVIVIDNWRIEEYTEGVIAEDFDEFYDMNVTLASNGSGEFSQTDNIPVSGSGRGLYIKCVNQYDGVKLTVGDAFQLNNEYKITMKYKVIDNPNLSSFYLQYGENYVEVFPEQEGLFEVNLVAQTDVLQMFSSAAGLEIVIDDLRIVKTYTPDSLFAENFDLEVMYTWAGNNTGEVKLTSEHLPTNGEGNALHVKCGNIYDGLIMTPIYQELEITKKYNISFNMKALIVPRGVVLYVQSGTNYVEVPITENMDEMVDVTLVAESNNIQLFTSIAGLEFTLDNWIIEECLEGITTENFDDFNELNILITSNNNGEFSQTDNIPASSSGNGLYIKCVNAFDGVQITTKDSFDLGVKYKITMKYKVVSNPNSSALYVQYGENHTQVYPEQGQDGVFEVELLANTNVLQIFSSAAGLEIVIDDLRIREMVE